MHGNVSRMSHCCWFCHFFYFHEVYRYVYILFRYTMV